MSALAEVNKHAAALESCAAAMEKDGVGLHPMTGHVALLRRMSGSMRADAANGKVPHEYRDGDQIHAAASEPPLPSVTIRALQAAGLPITGGVSVREFDERTEKAGMAVVDRIAAKRALERAGRLIT